MSGGHFNYMQSSINQIADSIEDYINGHELDDEDIKYYLNDRWTDDDEKAYIKEHHNTMPNPYRYSEETLNKMKEGMKIIKQAYIYAQRIDWLLSGDDGEKEFHERLKEELNELNDESR